MTLKERFWQLAFTPAIIAGYYYTHHPAFLFVYGFLLHILIIVLGFITAALIIKPEAMKEYCNTVKLKLTTFNIFIGWAYNLLGLGFLLYYEKFYLSTILIIYIFVWQIMKSCIKKGQKHEHTI